MQNRHWFLSLVVSRCRTGSRTDDNGTEHPGEEGKRLKRWPNNISRSRWVWMIMMMPQRMRKHSVEKTRVSSKLVSVSPPPPLRSALSQHDRQIIAVPTSRRLTNSHHLSTTKTLQSWVDSVASDFSKKKYVFFLLGHRIMVVLRGQSVKKLWWVPVIPRLPLLCLFSTHLYRHSTVHCIIQYDSCHS